jgi:hypothetical protein
VLIVARYSRFRKCVLIVVVCAGVGGYLQGTKARVGDALLSGKSLFSRAFSPIPLGNYANTIVQLSANTTITPDAVPTGTTSINVSTSTNFKGRLEGNPTTGVVRVTDAHPAGTYTVTVTAFDGGPSTKTFTLTVTMPAGTCNSVTFATAANFGAGINPRSVAVGDFNGDGKQDLVTANQNSDLPANQNSDLSVLLGDGFGSFGAATNFMAGSLPNSVALGDFNGDGKQDLAASNANSNNVSILLGNGADGFGAATNFGVGSIPTSVAVGDFNGDSRQDLAVANSGSNMVSILSGNGAGGFNPTANFQVGGAPQSLAVGDFNGDSKQDVAVANYGSATGVRALSILLRNDTGFNPATSLNAGANPFSVAVGDFNGDARQDLAVANSGSASVSVLVGNGAGGFLPAANFAVGATPQSVAVGDFNRDGKQDLAVANYGSDILSILLGNGGGSFSAATNFGTGDGPNSVAVGDFNGDGQQDLAIANYSSANVSVLLGQCASPPPTVGNYGNTSVQLSGNATITPDAAPTNTTSINVSTSTNFKGNLESDPTTGVVRVTDAHPAGTYTITVTALGPGGSTTKTFTLTVATPATCNPLNFGTATNFAVGISPRSVAVGDFNGDGKQDLAAPDANSGNVWILLGNGAGGFAIASNFGVGIEPLSVVVGDFNGDGNQDLAVVNFSSNNVSVLLGGGTGGFGTATNFDVGANPRSISMGDFNGDGNQDLVTANQFTSSLSVLLGNGAGGFVAANTLSAGTNPESVAVGDFNGDGKPDLASANFNSSVSIFLGNGAGGFSAAINFSAGINPTSVAVGEFNGDGKQDLAVANFNSSNVSVLLGLGTGSFSGPTNFEVGTRPGSVAVGDFNGDGKQDLAVANFDSANVSVLFGDGLGGFSAATNFDIGSGPNSVAVGDFNGDGKQDLATANPNSSTVSVLLRECPPPFVVTNINDNGAGSLRQAIFNANTNTGIDTITFNISGSGVHTISPISALPTITDPLVIDGYTQLGASVNTLATGDNAVLLIELDGTNAGASANGLVINAGSSTVRGLVINRFSNNGVSVQTGGGNIIEGNFIGTDTSGTTDMGNTFNGVLVTSAPTSRIGGSAPTQRNIISGNNLIGVSVTGVNSNGTVIQGNYIGTARFGAAALGNSFQGVLIRCPGATVGGTNPGAGNVISGNGSSANGSFGLEIIGVEATGNLVSGNLIGTNATGTSALPNHAGIQLANVNSNTIGGTTAAARNIISGNTTSALLLNEAPGNTIQGNFIGTDISGTANLGNGGGIIVVGTSDNDRFGGTTASERNVISGNNGDAIVITNASGTRVQGNFIGTQVNGTSALGNGGRGVVVQGTANNNMIGGIADGAGNTIASNGGDGVSISVGMGNLISSNSIFSNGSTSQDLGIDLGADGVTANDAGDGDTGANNLQNFPVLTAAVSTGGSTVVQGAFNSTPNTSFDIQFFSNQTCDPSRNGEGQNFVGSAIVTTDGSGNATINTTLAALALGQFVTATATDPGNNTSEFSACRIVAPSLSINDVSAIEGNSGTTSFMFTVSLSNPGSQAITVNYATANGTATTADNDYSLTSGTLTFNPGETSKPITVLVNRDTKFEPDETFFVNLFSPVNATIGDTQGQGTITNDDAVPSISISDVTANEGNSGPTSFTFTVSLSNASYQTVTVNYATADGTATTANNDYLSNSGTLIFAPGEASESIIVTVNGDMLNEPDETFFVDLSAPTNATIADNQGKGTITNDDPLPTLSINDMRVTEGNSGTVNAVFTVSLAPVSGQTVTVNYATADETATAGTDYQAISSTLIFNPGETSKTVNVPVIGDALNEGSETFFVNLSGATNATIADTQGVGTITNDDPLTLTIAGHITDAANNPLLDVKVTLSGPITRMVQSDVNGNYSFSGLAPGEKYTVTVQSDFYRFTPSQIDFLDLSINQTANFRAAPVDIPPPPPVLRDDFSSPVRDSSKWTLASDSQPGGRFDSAVTVTQDNGNLVITPRPDLSGMHYNGYFSVNSFDLNNGTASVEVVHAASATDGADTIFAIGPDSNNFFRFMIQKATAPTSLLTVKSDDDPKAPLATTGPQLVRQVLTAGQLSSQSIPYDPVQHKFMRFRHQLPTAAAPYVAIVFETSPDDITYTAVGDPQRFDNKPLESMTLELTAGTTRPDRSGNAIRLQGADALPTPEPAKFDNVKVSPPPPGAGNFKTVLAANQVAINTWTLSGRTYAYVRLTFPNAGYRVANWGLPAPPAGNDFSVDASIETFTGGSVQAVTTTAQIYDLGPLANGTYNFTFKNSGTPVTSQSFTVSSASPAPNPIDDAEAFVKQQYRDFLNREADQAGLIFWTDNITKCSNPPLGQTVAQCKLRQRETTSAAFFLSPEFQSTGYYVYRMYQGALGRQPKLSEFTPDAQFVAAGIVVNGQLSGVTINQNKATYAQQFVNCTDAAKYRCAEFKAIYDRLNNQQYVDRLFQTTGVNASASDRSALVNGLTAGTETRASVLQKVVDGIVMDSEGIQRFTTSYGEAFYVQQFNRAFVLLEYFGYLQRDPDEGGYAFWLSKLNAAGGNFLNAQMVLAFITSPEYRVRFGQP